MSMYNLVKTLLSNNTASNEQAAKYAQELDIFRFDANSIMNSLSQLMSSAPDNSGSFQHSYTVLSDIGTLFLMLTELSSLCAEREGHYREVIEIAETKLEEVS
jgi:hypothetical protein